MDAADLGDADLATKAEFLISLGLNRRDAAGLLQSTEESVRVSLKKRRKSGKAKNAKKR